MSPIFMGGYHFSFREMLYIHVLSSTAIKRKHESEECVLKAVLITIVILQEIKLKNLSHNTHVRTVLQCYNIHS
jgi:hypothetical protein